MDWIDFVSLMHYMVDTYGVAFGYGDEDGEFKYPITEEECQSAWFECCECGEPILYCDWKEEFSQYEDWKENEIACPICEYIWAEV
jgi:hypothetical protein